MSLLVCSFAVDNDKFALPVDVVMEVAVTGIPTRVPLAPPHIAGLINLRGRVLTSLCMRVKLGREPRAGCASVVVSHNGTTTALLVDSVDDVEQLSFAGILPVPANIPETIRNVLSGVYVTDSGTVGLLDLDAIFEEQSLCAY